MLRVLIWLWVLAILGLGAGDFVLKPLISGVLQVGAPSLAKEGGTRVRLGVDPAVPDAEAGAAAKAAVGVIERRLDGMNWAGATVRRDGPRGLVVEVPRIEDKALVSEIAGAGGRLTFQFLALPDETGGELLPQADGSGSAQVEGWSVVTSDDIVDAQPGLDSRTQEPIVNIRLNISGAERLARATTKNVGRGLAIILDKKILTAPRILSPITGGALQISGALSVQDVRRLAVLLRSGALARPLKIVDAEVVPPARH